MRKLFLFLLLASFSLAQTTSKPSPPTAAPSGQNAASAPSVNSDVPPTAPVITIPGVCASNETGAACKTEISREDFEKLANALNVPENRRSELANAYAQVLAVGIAAEKRGIADSPQTKEILKFVRLQTLARLLAQNIQEQASKVPQEEIQKYYDEHKDQFTQATLQRIFIPKNPPGAQEKPTEQAVKAEADKMEAAVKAPDADFAKLQQQAYDDLKIKSSPPPVDLKNIRRDNIPAPQQKIFDLAPGSVSDPLDETGGVYIYKLVSKEAMPVTEVQAEIKRALEQQRFQSEMEKLISSAKPELNPAYFGPEAEGPKTPAAPKGATVTLGTQPASKAPATAPKAPPKTPK